MKKIMQSFLILGLILNFNAVFSAGDKAPDVDIKDRVKQAYNQFRASEQSKRKFRYCAAGLGLMGIGGLIYHSWGSDEARQQQAENMLNNYNNLQPEQKAFVRKVLNQGHAATVQNLKLRMAARDAVAPAMSWSAAAGNYVFGTIKNAFFGVTTIGTAIVMAGIQGYGLSIFSKGVINPLVEKIVGIYSINRFISVKTKLNQNIKDILRALTAIQGEAEEDITVHEKLFDISFGLLEKDIFNILGFMTYIWSLINKDDEPVKSKARAIFGQVKKCLIDLRKLKMEDFDILSYRLQLDKLVEYCESFSGICEEAGTDYLEDFYISIFDQLRNSINPDIPAKKLPDADDMNAFGQMLTNIAANNPQMLADLPQMLADLEEDDEEEQERN